jgi:processive 1,2-diacylglycerol beta-glucosyltransferase
MQELTDKKILLLSVSAGAGHVRAAEALRVCAIRNRYVESAVHLDVMKYVPPLFRRLYVDSYLSLVTKHPLLWSYLYQTTDEAEPRALGQRIRRFIERMSTRELREEIAKQKPDIIICTHFMPAELLAGEIRRGNLNCPVWVQVTDFDLHRMWVLPRMRGYFAANEEVAYRMKARGIDASAIHVTGIPIMPAFSQELDRRECAKELDLNEDKTTILLMGGGAGIGSLDAVAENLLALGGDFQLIALAGHNAAALEKLRTLAKRFPGRLFVQGYSDKIERMMACSDFAITKPGGLTTSECLAMGLPMIVNAPIPGQEERNADYLLEEGVALKAFDTVTLKYRVQMLLLHPEQLAKMRKRARAISRASAANEALEVVLRNA